MPVWLTKHKPSHPDLFHLIKSSLAFSEPQVWGYLPRDEKNQKPHHGLNRTERARNENPNVCPCGSVSGRRRERRQQQMLCLESTLCARHCPGACLIPAHKRLGRSRGGEWAWATGQSGIICRFPRKPFRRAPDQDGKLYGRRDMPKEKVPTAKGGCQADGTVKGRHRLWAELETWINRLSIRALPHSAEGVGSCIWVSVTPQGEEGVEERSSRAPIFCWSIWDWWSWLRNGKWMKLPILRDL